MIRARELSVGQRLALGFGGLLLILAALLAVVFRWQAESERAQQRFSQQLRPLAAASADLERCVLRASIEVRAYLLQPEPARRQRYESAAAAARAAGQRLGAMPMDPDGSAIFAELAPALERYIGAADALVQRDRASPGDIAAELELVGMRAALMQVAQRHAALQEARTGAALGQIDAASHRVTTGLMTGAAVAVLVSVVLAWVTAQSVRRPARSLLGVATALRSGNWKAARAQLEAVTHAVEGNSGSSPNEMVQIGHALSTAAAALEQRENRLAADRRVAGAAASSVVAGEMATQALQAVLDHVHAEVGVVYALASEQSLTPIATWGLMGQREAAEPLAVGEGVPGQAAQLRRTLLVHDIPADSAFRVRLGYDAAPPRCVAAVPVMAQEALLGVLLVASLRALDEDATQFLEAAARQLGIGLANARSYAETQRLLAEVEQRNAQIQAQNDALQRQNEEIQSQTEELQTQYRELQTQSDEIRTQASALAETDRRKNEFLALLAHELRNPMAGISNSVALMSLPSAQGLHVAKAQAIIARQTRQLSRLIDDLLDVTRVSQGRITLRLEHLDLVQLARDSIDDQHSALLAAQLTLHAQLPDHPVFVLADRARLAQVVGNLLDNAIKFSQPGYCVHVGITADASHGRVRLSVQDEGVGISPAAMARLFEPFAQSDPTPARRTDGLGLGLSLVRSLVEMHGGTVTAHSDGEGLGALFSLEIPLHGDGSAAAAEAAAAPALPAWRGRATRILIIEDNIDAAESLAAAVEAEGYEVRIANSAADGLQVAATFKPDVLLCDIGLPVMDGYEVARRVRADDELNSVYLVAVTGYASQQDIEQAAQAGFDVHMAKPPDLQRLSVLLADVAIERARDTASADPDARSNNTRPGSRSGSRAGAPPRRNGRGSRA